MFFWPFTQLRQLSGTRVKLDHQATCDGNGVQICGIETFVCLMQNETAIAVAQARSSRLEP